MYDMTSVLIDRMVYYACFDPKKNPGKLSFAYELIDDKLFKLDNKGHLDDFMQIPQFEIEKNRVYELDTEGHRVSNIPKYYVGSNCLYDINTLKVMFVVE